MSFEYSIENRKALTKMFQWNIQKDRSFRKLDEVDIHAITAQVTVYISFI